MVLAVHQELLALLIILHQRIEDMPDPCPGIRIIDRCCHLYPAQGISGHEIRRGDIHFLLIPDTEAIDPGMLQIPAYNADHANPVGFARNARNQAANAADHHFDADACLGSRHQLLDDGLVRQGIDLHADIGGLSGLRQRDLLVHHFQHTILQTVGSHQQVLHAIVLDGVAHHQAAEYLGRIAPDLLVRRH